MPIYRASRWITLLPQALRCCQNQAIEVAQVIEELIELARDMREAASRKDDEGIAVPECAVLYSKALAQNGVFRWRSGDCANR